MQYDTSRFRILFVPATSSRDCSPNHILMSESGNKDRLDRFRSEKQMQKGVHVEGVYSQHPEVSGADIVNG